MARYAAHSRGTEEWCCGRHAFGPLIGTQTPFFERLCLLQRHVMDVFSPKLSDAMSLRDTECCILTPDPTRRSLGLSDTSLVPP